MYDDYDYIITMSEVVCTYFVGWSWSCNRGVRVASSPLAPQRSLCLRLTARPNRLAISSICMDPYTTWVQGRVRAQELCESRGGRPGLQSLISLRFLWT